MHCILINVVPTLWDIWTAEHFKNDDIKNASDDNYLFSKKELDIFDEVIRDSRGDIPAVIGTMPRSFRWRHRWKAVEWRMFLEYFGTSLTNGHLPEKEHRNFCELRQIWVSSIKHSIDANEIAVLDQTARIFVKGYERLYYRQDPERLTCCKINNHMLLHIASCIEDNGPARYWWSFPIERFCFEARGMATSKSQITTSVNNGLLRRHQLALLSLTHRLGDSGEDEFSRRPVLKNPVNLSRDYQQLPLRPHLSRHLAQKLDVEESQLMLSYFSRCRPPAGNTIGSVASQQGTDVNRNDCFVCFRRAGEQCRFGTVYGFLQDEPSQRQFAILKRWTGIRKNLRTEEIRYENTNGAWCLVDPCDIQCLVGTLQETNHGHAGWRAKMIIGALEPVKKYGAE